MTIQPSVPCPPLVYCILLNWNGWKDTLSCVAALRGINYANIRVLIVDNGSSDDSAERLRSGCPDIQLLETGRNMGFAGGNNYGIRHALKSGADYIWLLNNDTKPQPGALAALVEKAKSNPRLGEVGSVLWYMDNPKKLQAWGGGKVNHLIGFSRHAEKQMDDGWFDYMTAASILVPKAAFEDVGLLEERIFLYWEDTEFGFRLRKHGWQIGVAENSHILHRVNASTEKNRHLHDQFSTTSGLVFLSLYSPVPLISSVIFVTLRLGKRLLRGDLASFRSICAGVADFAQKRPALRIGGKPA